MKTHETTVQPGAEPIYRISNRDRGVLLLHGYLGSPFEMRSLAQRCSEDGFSVSVPRYPGHGTSMDDMVMTYGRDWFGAARDAFIELSSQCKEVSIVGLSMGAAFAVLLAREFHTPKIALLSMPAGIAQKTIYLTPVLRYFKKVLYRSATERAAFNRGINDPEARARHVGCFDGIPVAQAWELHRILQQARAALPHVVAPALLMQSRGDDTIPPWSLDFIDGHIGSRHKRVVWLELSNHAITVDTEKEVVTETVLSFLRTGDLHETCESPQGHHGAACTK